MTKKLIPLGLTSDGKSLVLGPAGDCASGYVRVEDLVGFFTPPSQRQRAKCIHRMFELDENHPSRKAGWKTVCINCGQKGR